MNEPAGFVYTLYLKQMVTQMSNTDSDMLRVISELLNVQHHYMNLDMFSMSEVTDMIETLCIT